jgi:hypothetical protein
MALYEIAPDRLTPLQSTTFAAEGVRERTDLQRLLREQVEIISPDTLVLAEEFGEWEDSRRRIDLLGVDRDGSLVVIELKRTDDGGHMELQAVRYAAMVSTMIFDQAVDVFGAHLRRLGRTDDPRTVLLDFLGWEEPDEDRFAQDVKIVLASAEFSREITTAVMWLNERGLDIRCVRLRPYRHGERVLLDVQQVIPLPEAAEYQIRVREKVQREREARQTAGSRDYTRFVVTTPQGVSGPLAKRRAVLEVVKALKAAGAPFAEIQRILEEHHDRGSGVFRSTGGDLDSEGFIAAVIHDSQAAGPAFDSSRYFCKSEDLIHSDGRTYALTNQWGGPGTAETMDALLRAFPDRAVSYAVADGAG